MNGPGTQRATKIGCGVDPIIEGPENFMLPEIIVFVASTVFFILRLANRATRMAPWGWDDTTISIAWASPPPIQANKFPYETRLIWLPLSNNSSYSYLVSSFWELV